jgi:hypothetical protein
MWPLIALAAQKSHRCLDVAVAGGNGYSAA